MCKNCGCSGGSHHHHHEHDHDHHHEHVHYDENGNPYTHSHEHTETRTVPLETAILAANDQAAEVNRAYFREHGMAVINLISSPGSGKTTLLERTLELLQAEGIKTAVIVGDQYSELDAERMRGRGAPVTQIQTLDSCHLNAEQIARILPEAVPAGTELLIIENIGNLVCPTAFDLGEDHKVALLSTPEGEEKPIKYPALFAAADVVLLTKMDLAEILGWNRELCLKNISLVNRSIQIIDLSVRNGLGVDCWLKYLKKLISSKKEEIGK